MSKEYNEVSGFSKTEEIANSITHGIGALLSISGLVLLITYAAHRGTAWHVVTCTIFGTALTLLYLSSSLYHAIPTPRIKKILLLMDHSAIYLLIAGTYTPFMLGPLRRPWGWSLVTIVWVIAIAGIILTLTSLKKIRVLSPILYLAMGWLVIIAVKPLLAVMDAEGFRLLLLGGLAYTSGLIFYVWEKIPYSHAIWHMFVLAGSCFHYFAVFYYVLPS